MSAGHPSSVAVVLLTINEWKCTLSFEFISVSVEYQEKSMNPALFWNEITFLMNPSPCRVSCSGLFFQNSSHISSLCDCCPERNTFALILKELMPNLTSCWRFRPVKSFTVVAWNNWVIAMGYYPIGGRKNKPLKRPRKDTLRVAVLIYLKLDFSFKSLKQMYVYF